MGTRSLYLVRHGHYHTDKDSARYGKLTALGRRQAIRVGKRLASIELDVMHHSDTLRAVETAEIIAKQLALEIPTRTSKLLREGVPTAPVPWLPHFTRAESEENPSPKQHALRCIRSSTCPSIMAPMSSLEPHKRAIFTLFDGGIAAAREQSKHDARCSRAAREQSKHDARCSRAARTKAPPSEIPLGAAP